MTGITSDPRSRHGGMARWLVALALPVALAVGCGDSNNTPHTATPTATHPAATATATSPPATATATPPNASAQAACAKIERCGQCFTNSTGSCITTDACAQRLAADVAICINAGSACTADMLGDCLFLGCDGADASGDCQ